MPAANSWPRHCICVATCWCHRLTVNFPGQPTWKGRLVEMELVEPPRPRLRGVCWLTTWCFRCSCCVAYGSCSKGWHLLWVFVFFCHFYFTAPCFVVNPRSRWASWCGFGPQSWSHGMAPGVVLVSVRGVLVVVSGSFISGDTCLCCGCLWLLVKQEWLGFVVSRQRRQRCGGVSHNVRGAVMSGSSVPS